MPVTSTLSPLANRSAWITWPIVKAELSSTRISARCLATAWLAFLKWPVSGLLTRRVLTSPKASWMAEYPSRSGVLTWTTRQGPAWMTVTGTARFCSSQIWVMPIFWPRMPRLDAIALRLLDLDLDVDAGRQVEPLEGVDGLRRRLEDVEQPLVDPHLEVLARVLVDVGGADHAVTVDLGGERDGAPDTGLRADDRLDDLLRRLVDDLVIVGLEPDPDLLSFGVRNRAPRSLPFGGCTGGVAPRVLLDDLDHPAGADGAATFPDGEPEAFLHGDRVDELDGHLGVVTGHDHLHALRQLAGAGDVGRAEVELRPVVVEERGVPPALLLGQDVDLGLEVGVRGDRARLGQDLAPLHVLLLGA